MFVSKDSLIVNRHCCRLAHIAGIILVDYRIIAAVGKHIVAQDALAGGGVGVGVYEASEVCIVVAGLEVIEAPFGIVDIATVAQGVQGAALYNPLSIVRL